MPSHRWTDLEGNDHIYEEAGCEDCSSYQHVSVIKRDWIIGTSQGSIRGWNYERPHQGIRYLYPADVYFHDRCG
jgi:hypothetical protein